MSIVRTVTGDVPVAELGRVLTHEHLLCLLPGPGLAGPSYVDEQVDAAVTALRGLPELGFRTVVDLSPYGDAGRSSDGANSVLLAQISQRSGLNIVAGTATYRAEFSPPWVLDASIDELVRRFVDDATTGVGPTSIRAGILGEQPTSEGHVTEHERRGLRAAARAHHATGLAINTHTTHGTMALEQIDLLADEGVSPDRMVIGHMDNQPDLGYVRRVLDRGVTIGFDSIGKQHWDVRRPPISRPDGRHAKTAIAQSDHTRARYLAALVDEGYAEQIVLSQDLAGMQVWQNPATHGRHGYAYLAKVFLPLLAEHGVGDEAVDTMLRANPARLLALPR
jgi:predicted metal-dependent phosphotriesterase family hydrolase